jgi:hypothetical protein
LSPLRSKGRGLYNGKYPPPRGGGEYQPMSFGGKNIKRPREKGRKCGRKGRKGERKRKKGERKLEKRKHKGKINAK